MLRPEIIERIEGYALGHCPFSGCKIWEEVEFELTETTRGKNSPELESIWYVHAWVPSLQAAYGLFVTVWKDGNVGGIIESDGMQKIFEYFPSQMLPTVINWGTTA